MSVQPPDIVADVCVGCGALVEDWTAHGRHHADLGTLAAIVQRLLDQSRQANRLTLARNLTIQPGGIPAGGSYG